MRGWRSTGCACAGTRGAFPDAKKGTQLFSHESLKSCEKSCVPFSSFLLLARPTARSETGLKAEPNGRLFLPLLVSVRPATVCRFPQGSQFDFALRLIDEG